MAAQHDEVATHLQHCAACSNTYAKLLELHAMLDVPELPSPEFASRFQQNLARELQNRRVTGHKEKQSVRLFHALWPARPAWAFAYSVLLLSCGLVSGQLLPPETLGFRESGGTALASEGVAISPEQLVRMCSVQNPQNSEVL